MTIARTHPSIDARLCGRVLELDEGLAVVELATTREMAADPRGLVHGGFVFGAADYAAMLAVNDPNVVLGAADVRFLAPVRVGEVVRCEAKVEEAQGQKRRVAVSASSPGGAIFRGTFTCFVLERHVLDREKVR